MKHVGRYYEAQIGPAPTQMHTFPLPASSTFEWTEWFKGFDGDVERLLAIGRSARGHAGDEASAALASAESAPQSEAPSLRWLLPTAVHNLYFERVLLMAFAADWHNV